MAVCAESPLAVVLTYALEKGSPLRWSGLVLARENEALHEAAEEKAIAPDRCVFGPGLFLNRKIQSGMRTAIDCWSCMHIIADSINIMNPKVGQALQDLDPEPIRGLASRCSRAGVDAVDINPGPLRTQAKKRLALLVETVQEETGLPLVLDGNDAELMRFALDLCRQRPILNGFSLEPQRLEAMLPLAVESGCRIVGFLLNEQSQVPGGLEERLETFQRLYELSMESGLEPEQLIIDPVIVPLMWENGISQAQAVLDTIAHLPEMVGHSVASVVGLSNLTTSSSGHSRSVVEQAYLSMLTRAGLDMALMNPERSGVRATAAFCNLLQGSDIFTWAEVEQFL